MVVRVMTGATTISALMELCFSPFFGQVLEKIGRKRLLIMMGLTKFPTYAMMAIRPSLFWLALGPMVDEAMSNPDERSPYSCTRRIRFHRRRRRNRRRGCWSCTFLSSSMYVTCACRIATE